MQFCVRGNAGLHYNSRCLRIDARSQKVAGEFPDFRWERLVSASGMFPDVRKVQVIVAYGPRLSQSFALVEFMHSPVPIDPNQLQGAAR